MGEVKTVVVDHGFHRMMRKDSKEEPEQEAEQHELASQAYLQWFHHQKFVREGLSIQR
jgi:hypothetical protein